MRFSALDLDLILSSEGNTRVLRYLLDRPEGVKEAVLVARMPETPRGVRLALSRLEEAGVLDRELRPGGRWVSARPDWPLTPALRALFRSERLLRRDLLEKLRDRNPELSRSPLWVLSADRSGACSSALTEEILLDVDGTSVPVRPVPNETRGAPREVVTS